MHKINTWCVLVVLLHACFSIVGPIPFLLAAIFFRVIPIILPYFPIVQQQVAINWQGHIEDQNFLRVTHGIHLKSLIPHVTHRHGES